MDRPLSTPPAPYPPELPAGVDPAPRWPAWYAAAGFFVALFGTLVAVGIVSVFTGTGSEDEVSPTFTVFATLAQDIVFVGTAVAFASLTARPRAWHFGLRGTSLGQAVAWASVGVFSFYFFAVMYGAIVQPDVDQGITESLGADQGTVGLIAAGMMVMIVAPVAEEFFFRGFFYRALRSRFSVIVAALLDGALFGLIHWDVTSDGLLILPPLAALGFILCLVLERTGSLYPVIAIHVLNNSIAYAVQADGGWIVSVTVGPAMIAACAILPRVFPSSPRRPVPA
jgi:CAAX protease family protein